MKVRPNSFRIKLRYWFDNTLNSGTIALIGWLALVSACVVIISAIVVTIFNVDPQEKDIQFFEALWISTMRTLDPGNLSNDNGWAFRWVMFAVTILGVLIVSTLIGIVNAGISQTLENLRKGKSFVSEHGHILILGWSPLIYSLLNKLVFARPKNERLVLVILADRDKIEMEDEIRSKVHHDKKVRIICRSGSVIDRHDIEIVNPHEARTIVVMAQEGDIHDTHSIKSIMALMKSHNRKSEKYHIVVEVRDRQNLEVLDLIGKDEITPVVSEELFSRITVQTSLQSGLSEVYNELLDFNDIETEFVSAAKYAGQRYDQTLLDFSEGALIGIQNNDRGSDANPAADTIIQPDDTMMVITRKGKMVEHAAPAFNKDIFSALSEYKKAPEHTLLLGWNSKAPEIIRTLDQHFTQGSKITVFADTENLDHEIEEVSAGLVNQTLTLIRGNIRNRAKLTEMVGTCGCRHVILLCYSESLDVQSADSLTLITLIHLRQMAEDCPRSFTIVSEILDIRNRALAEVTHADDFIVSDNLISMVMAQLAINIDLKKVFDELLTPGGSEICLRPINDYVNIDHPLNFYSIVASAARYNQTAIGYRIAAESDNPEDKYGVVLAPSKSQMVQFTAQDRIIVIAGL